MTPEEREEAKDRLRRYEDARWQHLSDAVNLTFGLSGAGVGFCASILTSKDAPPFKCPGNYFFVAAMVLFVVAVASSMFITWTRLRDFRLTAQKLRAELREQEISVELGKRADCFGVLTWWGYRIQVVTFFVAVLSLIIFLWTQYKTRMFP